MAYYYVKSGLTGTGDQGRYASQQTGAFPTGTGGYASLEDATNGATTAPVAGDFICISNSSSLSTSTAFNYNNAPAYTTSAGQGVTIVCVDDSNCENSAIATSSLETITGGVSDWSPQATANEVVNIYGVYAQSEDNIVLSGASGMTNCFGCTFYIPGAAGDAILFNQLALGACGSVNLYDTTLKLDSPFGSIALSYGAVVKMHGGAFDVSGGTRTDFINDAFFGGGCQADFIGVDFSGVSDNLVENQSATSNDDHGYIRFVKCQLNATTNYLSTSAELKWNQKIEVYNSAHDSTAEWQYYIREEQCEAEATSSTYRDQSVAWPVTGSKTSIAVDTATSGNATISRPFVFDLPSRYAALSSTSTDLITIYLSGPSGLTDADIWAVAVYPDGTNAHVPNHEVSSSLTDYADAFDPFRTGTALTADTGSSWTSGGTNNYRIEIDTSGDAGTDSVPIIRVFVSDLSGTVYIDSQVDLS